MGFFYSLFGAAHVSCQSSYFLWRLACGGFDRVLHLSEVHAAWEEEQSSTFGSHRRGRRRVVIPAGDGRAACHPAAARGNPPPQAPGEQRLSRQKESLWNGGPTAAGWLRRSRSGEANSAMPPFKSYIFPSLHWLSIVTEETKQRDWKKWTKPNRWNCRATPAAVKSLGGSRCSPEAYADDSLPSTYSLYSLLRFIFESLVFLKLEEDKRGPLKIHSTVNSGGRWKWAVRSTLSICRCHFHVPPLHHHVHAFIEISMRKK